MLSHGDNKPDVDNVLFEQEYKQFVDIIAFVKILSRYSSSFGKHIKAKKIGSLKSHDYHILMQQLMPLALRGLLKPRPCLAVMRMCKIFRRICTKVYNLAEFESL